MTEAEWLVCRDYLELLRKLRSQAADRKWRLASFACVQLLPTNLQECEIAEAIALAERIAENGIKPVEVEAFVQKVLPFLTVDYLEATSQRTVRSRTAFGILRSVGMDRKDEPAYWIMDSVGAVADFTVRENTKNYSPLVSRVECLMRKSTSDAVGAQTCDILRDIFGNPFRPVTFSPSWRTDTALTLAHQMYDSRDFSAMPILADALQDAGCDDDDILNHCRGDGLHVRGCWVVDLVLGKE